MNNVPNTSAMIAASEFKNVLNEKIIQEVQRKQLTHAQVSQTISCSRPKVTRVMNRNLQKVSIEFLLRLLHGLGIRTVPVFE